MKIFESNYTQIPNELLDNMSTFNPAEFLVVMFICRKTFGWQKNSDRLSLSQIQEGTGLSKQGVVNSINSLIERDIIFKSKSKLGNTYSVVVNSVYQDSQLSLPPVVNSVDTQKKFIKDTNINKKTVTPAELPPDESEHKKIIDTYWKLYEDNTGNKPTWNDAIGKHTKELLKQHPVKLILDKLYSYFNHEYWFNRDKYTRDKTYSFNSFRMHFDEIIVDGSVESFEEMAKREAQ